MIGSRMHEPGRVGNFPLKLIAQAIPKLTRHELAAVTERLIDRLDELDPHPDAEEDDPDRCPAGDDGCGPVLIHGRIHWGATDEEQGT